jgi:ABC-type uncharacterized transport system ATPase subunit
LAVHDCPHVANDYFRKRRIGLAQALLNRPELNQGTTVFLNSHLLSEVEVTCDRVALVRKGRLVKELLLKG